MFKWNLTFWTSGLTILVVCVIVKATDENVKQHYLPLLPSDQILNTNKRFQNMMQGSSSSSENNWPTPKIDRIDVKSELAKLNTSYIYQGAWPEANVQLGAVTAVSFDTDGNVVIFHRVDRIWGPKTFDQQNRYTEAKLGPITENTVLALERQTGKLVYGWGKKLFYMPHGLTIDRENNVWVTDVALHQIFKFGPRGANEKPLLTLGTAFTPGAGSAKFCKPTAVAVLENGDFFVADGYCNARILKYTKNGEKILSWGQNSFSGASHEVAPKNFFAIPHGLTLVPEKEQLCVADRENGRVQCFYWTNGTFVAQYHNQVIGDRLFSMAYTPAEGGELIIVNGPEDVFGELREHYSEVRGFVLNMQSEQVTSKFGPNNLQFENPHDVAVTKDGLEVYVAELNPPRIHKFLHRKIVKPILMSIAKPVTTSAIGMDLLTNANNTNNNLALDSVLNMTASTTHTRPGGTAILVVTLMLLFAFLTFAMALLIAHRRKRGCLPFGDKNRVHAWDKTDGFKLGGLLQNRSKRSGFERLDQDGSDEEQSNAVHSTPFV